MNKKKLIGLIALVIVIALTATLFTACNKFKWDSVGGGNASAATLSNGGYYVEQGSYAYFINGYDAGSTDAEGTAVAVDNTWGTPMKNGIVRVSINADGSYNNDSAVVVVPKQIFNNYKKGGFAVFGDWIYYATPNNDENKSGVASTTHTDFMRTRIDGSVTQVIFTLNTRDSEYLFTPTRIIYRESSTATTVNYVDFSGMKADKNIDNGKGATTGVLAENVSEVFWDYDASYTAGQGSVISDYVVYTEKLSGDDSYEFCNNLCAVKYDGSDKKTLANKFTYLTDAEKENYTAYFKDKVFSFKLLAIEVESDSSMTLYYTKSNYINAAAKSTGLYCNTFDLTNGFSTANEKHLTNTDPTAVYPLSYADGALIVANSNYYYVKHDINSAEFASEWNGSVYDKTVVGRAATVLTVDGGYVYYYDSNNDAIYRINLVVTTGASPNETKVLSAKFKADWLNFEVDGANFRYFDTADYNYLHVVNLADYNGELIESTTFIGKMTDADSAAKKAAEEAAAKA